MCGKEMKATDAPGDPAFFGFIGLALLCLFLGIGLAIMTTGFICVPLGIAMAGISAAYMYNSPSAYANYPAGSPPTGEQMQAIHQPQPSTPSYMTNRQSTGYYSRKYSGATTDKSSTLTYQEGGYHAESACPHCGMRMQTPTPGSVVKCPYCGNDIQG
jgi:hypothetical protein